MTAREEEIKALVEAAVAAEREACANVCDSAPLATAPSCASAIRGRRALKSDTLTMEDLLDNVIRNEREACARICDANNRGAMWEGEACAQQIRARGKTK